MLGLEEYKIWTLGGKHKDELTNLVGVFYDLALAKEFVDAEHGGYAPYYAIQHDNNIIYANI